MMEKLRNPKNVKTVSLIVAAIFVIGCFTLAMSAGGFGSSVASAAGSESAIGVVDYQVLVSQYPKLEQLNSEMEKAKTEARAEFDSKSQNMNDEQKEAYYRQNRCYLRQGKTEWHDELEYAILVTEWKKQKKASPKP